jgi:type IV secretion system protein VirD4
MLSEIKYYSNGGCRMDDGLRDYEKSDWWKTSTGYNCIDEYGNVVFEEYPPDYEYDEIAPGDENLVERLLSVAHDSRYIPKINPQENYYEKPLFRQTFEEDVGIEKSNNTYIGKSKIYRRILQDKSIISYIETPTNLRNSYNRASNNLDCHISNNILYKKSNYPIETENNNDDYNLIEYKTLELPCNNCSYEYPFCGQDCFNYSQEEIPDDFFFEDDFRLGMDSEENGNKIPDKMINSDKNDTGVFFGKKNIDGEIKYVGKPTDIEGNVLVIGGEGSGKSSCFSIPTINSWKGRFVAIDIKGELISAWEKIKTPKASAKIIDFTGKLEESFSYDPYYFLRSDSKDNLALNARELSNQIIQIPCDANDTFWLTLARMLLTSAIMHFFRDGASFIETISYIQTHSLKEIISLIAQSDCADEKMLIKDLMEIDDLSSNKMAISISAELSSKISEFASNLKIIKTFNANKNCATWDDLETHNIIIRVPQDMISQMNGAIALMINQLINSLERRPEKYSKEGENLMPILILLDEFPRLGRVERFEGAISTLRSKGVTFCTIVQSIAQLDAFYGENNRRIILDNCPYKAVFRVTDRDNQRLISDLIGTTKVMYKTKGVTIDAFTGEIGSYNYSISESPKYIIEPHELATIEDILLLTPYGFMRVDKSPYFLNEEVISDENN